ncbi:MAG: ankyrin repeat domain-containing protein [Planctomycetota bacterium]
MSGLAIRDFFAARPVIAAVIAMKPMVLRLVALILCASLSFEVDADERTPEQKLILACFNLHIDDVVAALRNGADVECTFGRGDARLHFRDQWTGGWPAHALRWTPLQALANSSPYPPPPIPYENNTHRITWAQRAQRDVDPSMIADRNARRLAIFRILFSHGCDIDVRDLRGASPLHDAVSNRHIGMVKMLLRHGAEVNTKTGIYIDGPGDVTPLHVASRWSPTLAKLLIDHGADTTAVDSNNRTPEDYRLGITPGVDDPFGGDGAAGLFD